MGCQSSKPQIISPPSSIDTEKMNERNIVKEKLQNELEKITKIMLKFEQLNQPSNSIYIEIKNRIAYLNTEIKFIEDCDTIMNEMDKYGKTRPNYRELAKNIRYIGN
jgi:hypothetical protein